MENEKANKKSSGNNEVEKINPYITMSYAVPKNIKITEEVHDPDKHIHASFLEY